MKKLIIFLFIISLAISAEKINIGTGSKKGVYYPVGNSICAILNGISSIECKAYSSVGSKYNIFHTLKGIKFNLGIAQSDIIYRFYTKRRQFKKLRTIMAIYPEILTLVVKKDSGINKLEDILNYSIGIGNKGSGTFITSSLLIRDVLGVNDGVLPNGLNTSSSKINYALKNNEISGYFYVIGHPNNHLKEIMKQNSVKLIDLNPNENENIKKLLKKYPYYKKAVIKKGTYKDIEKDIVSFGVKATLIVSADMDEKIVELITRELLNKFDKLKKSHPALKNIKKKKLIQGLGAPLHKGAKKVYKEKGLL